MKATLNARLKTLRMNYPQYLASDHWQETRRRYRESDMPQACLVCEAHTVELHHISYARLGRELLGDLMPLCRTCHGKVHEYEKTHTTNLTGIEKILREIAGWTRKETKVRLARFNIGGIQNIEEHLDLLTPRQRLRELRKTDPDNPAHWTPKMKRQMGDTHVQER